MGTNLHLYESRVLLDPRCQTVGEKTEIPEKDTYPPVLMQDRETKRRAVEEADGEHRPEWRRPPPLQMEYAAAPMHMARVHMIRAHVGQPQVTQPSPASSSSQVVDSPSSGGSETPSSHFDDGVGGYLIPRPSQELVSMDVLLELAIDRGLQITRVALSPMVEGLAGHLTDFDARLLNLQRVGQSAENYLHHFDQRLILVEAEFRKLWAELGTTFVQVRRYIDCVGQVLHQEAVTLTNQFAGMAVHMGEFEKDLQDRMKLVETSQSQDVIDRLVSLENDLRAHKASCILGDTAKIDTQAQMRGVERDVDSLREEVRVAQAKLVGATDQLESVSADILATMTTLPDTSLKIIIPALEPVFAEYRKTIAVQVQEMLTSTEKTLRKEIQELSRRDNERVDELEKKCHQVVEQPPRQGNWRKCVN